jgi:ornithine cyclodeaminase
MVKFFGVQELVAVLQAVGVEQFLFNLIGYTRDDFLRWPKFEKSARLASHTAATSALAGTCLARRGSKVMALIGLGAQAEFQALAFKAAVGIKQLRVFDVDPAAVAKFGINMRGSGLDVIAADCVASAVEGADIVTTATAAKRNAVILTSDMIGLHQQIDLVPELEDPKDLFGLVTRAPGPSARSSAG